jgi:para-nitrobenzyl esterase
MSSQPIPAANQRPVSVFKGIPYGTANRFEAPRKAESWTGVRNTANFGPAAPQPAFTAPPPALAEIITDPGPMGEDCLVLNIWTPATDSAKRPVMVWLHGGGFSYGSGASPAYAGTELAAKRDVVVVTVNHRLNLFGYLYLAQLGGGRYADSGNAGMLDIVLALEWVRDNIAVFGGDPDNVTIFGESGGGWKVSTLMAMPAAQGLFHKAIVQSGPFLRAMTPDRATQVAVAVLSRLGLQPNQAGELENLPMGRLLEGVYAIPGGPLAITPVVDGRSVPTHPFHPVAPAISAGVPLLIGSTATETTLLEPPPDHLDDSALLAKTKERMGLDDAAAERLLAVYKKTHGDNVEAWLALASDNFMRINSIRQAEAKAAQNAAPAYMYLFTWRTPAFDGKLRSPHALEIPFVFDHPDVWPSFTAGEQRYALADKMSAAWTEFARTGKPSHPELPDWPTYTTDRRATMIFDNECRVADDPYGEDRAALELSGCGSTWLPA